MEVIGELGDSINLPQVTEKHRVVSGAPRHGGNQTHNFGGDWTDCIVRCKSIETQVNILIIIISSSLVYTILFLYTNNI